MKPSTDLSSLTSTLEENMNLSDLGITKHFKSGETIVSENAPVRSIPIVTAGSVKVMQSDDTYKEMVLYYLQPGETCIMSFLSGLYHDASKVKAVAEEDSEVLFIPVDKIHDLIREHPEWLNYIFRIYHKRFIELLSVVDAVAFKKMDERLLQFLQKRCEVMETDTLAMTHDQLAQELGTAREVISRLLKKMEEKGLVRLGRNKITLM
ncbi:Crp/Fnr family transcriptional regulator [Aliifodinibius salipaludis]|uniref:Crp/Fnr family transcriptional regulator n=1 Tax=Fodinibius salipaludis TaxID=2032627 RepID=A0A2A2GE10_9BACT|nr:Crp/Fnr family transcriptional regulator [Aliifodinibius salipaludis]PAU95109.1 Crp/Fnr family transcriptional regulator [Aliifodinibius salipaludis]